MITFALSVCTKGAVVLHPVRCYTSALYIDCNQKYALFNTPGRVLLWGFHTKQRALFCVFSIVFAHSGAESDTPYIMVFTFLRRQSR